MFLRLAIVVLKEHSQQLEHGIMEAAGAAVQFTSWHHDANEARIRLALAGPDVMIIASGLEAAATEALIRACGIAATPVILWQSEPNHPELPVSDSVVGIVTSSTPTNVVVDLLERSAQLASHRAEAMVQKLRQPGASYRPDMIAFPHIGGLEVRSIESICHVRGDGNYTVVSFDTGSNIVMSRTIGDYDEVLPPSMFLRIHRSHYINIQQVRKVVRGKIMRVVLSNEEVVDVADSKREQLLQCLNILRRRRTP
ncbi:MAG: LytTR family transcriptional regulator [Candidatus Kapabacteria bacterium]|nr:LytTR family transcriptional regulator [Candidatus Kapabacteria bacterium]